MTNGKKEKSELILRKVPDPENKEELDRFAEEMARQIRKAQQRARDKQKKREG